MITILSTLASFHPHKHTHYLHLYRFIFVCSVYESVGSVVEHTQKNKNHYYFNQHESIIIHRLSVPFPFLLVWVAFHPFAPSIQIFSLRNNTTGILSIATCECMLSHHIVFIFTSFSKWICAPPDQQHQQRGGTKKHCSGTRHFKWLVDIIQHVERTQYNSGKEIEREREKELDCVSSPTLL